MHGLIYILTKEGLKAELTRLADSKQKVYLQNSHLSTID